MRYNHPIIRSRDIGTPGVISSRKGRDLLLHGEYTM